MSGAAILRLLDSVKEAVQLDCTDSLGGIMDAENVCPVLQRDEIRHLRGRQDIGRRDTQRSEQKALAGETHKNLLTELLEHGHLTQQLPVLLHRLGETETGIQDPVPDPMPVRLGGDPLENSRTASVTLS